MAAEVRIRNKKLRRKFAPPGQHTMLILGRGEMTCAREEAASTTVRQLPTFTDCDKDKLCEARKGRKEECLRPNLIGEFNMFAPCRSH